MTEETSLEQIVMPLLSWYDGHARVLPWRESLCRACGTC